MSDTPETDKIADAYAHLPSMADTAIWSHARRLERERDAQMLRADRMDGLHSMRKAELRDALETIADMETRHVAVMVHTQAIVNEANEYKAQRDRLAEALERIMNIKPDDRNADAGYWSFQFGRCQGIAKSALAAVKGGNDE